MRSPIGRDEEGQLAPVEALLREAAAFEPAEPVPGLLTAGGIAQLLAEETAGRRRTVRARVAVFAATLTGAAACSASLVLALNQPIHRIAARPIAPVQVTERAPTVNVKHTVEASAPAEAPRRTLRRPVRRLRLARCRQPSPTITPPVAPVWTDATVERQVTGVLAQAWLVQPDEEGGLQLTPTLVDLSVEAAQAACELNPEPTPLVAPTPETNSEENEAR